MLIKMIDAPRNRFFAQELCRDSVKLLPKITALVMSLDVMINVRAVINF